MAKSKGEGNGDGSRKVNKSAAVREALKADPKARSKDIVALLGAQGIRVAPTLVYYIKSRQKHAVRQEKRKQAAENPARGFDVVALIVKVKELAVEAGGMANLKRLVDVLA